MSEFIQLLATDVSRLKSDCSRLKIDIYELIEMNRLLEGMEPGFLGLKEALYLTKGLTLHETREHLHEAARRAASETGSSMPSVEKALQAKLASVEAELAALKPATPQKAADLCKRCVGVGKQPHQCRHKESNCYDLHPEKRPQRTATPATSSLALTSSDAWVATSALAATLLSPPPAEHTGFTIDSGSSNVFTTSSVGIKTRPCHEPIKTR